MNAITTAVAATSAELRVQVADLERRREAAVRQRTELDASRAENAIGGGDAEALAQRTDVLADVIVTLERGRDELNRRLNAAVDRENAEAAEARSDKAQAMLPDLADLWKRWAQTLRDQAALTAEIAEHEQAIRDAAQADTDHERHQLEGAMSNVRRDVAASFERPTEPIDRAPMLAETDNIGVLADQVARIILSVGVYGGGIDGLRRSSILATRFPIEHQPIGTVAGNASRLARRIASRGTPA